MRAALVQLTTSDEPGVNLETTRAYVKDAAVNGASFVLTPEVTNCVSTNRDHQEKVLVTEDKDETLKALKADAKALGIHLLIGSLALKQTSDDTRFVNRSFLIGPDGDVRARYDKIHMFDVTVSDTEAYRESAGYRPGTTAQVAIVGRATIGMTICYDLRFPGLYRDIAKTGAQILTVPSAFTVATGQAHWETLLRARAIETGSFVLAPAQCGTHRASAGKPRKTYGHSLAVDPWGKVLADGGESPGVTLVDLNLEAVDDARRRIPSLIHDRGYVIDDG